VIPFVGDFGRIVNEDAKGVHPTLRRKLSRNFAPALVQIAVTDQPDAALHHSAPHFWRQQTFHFDFSLALKARAGSL
jgi:hypothetical protein